MGKKLFFATSVAILIVTVSTFLYVNREQNANSAIFNANVEALANEESTSGKAICYSQFTASENSYCLVCVQCEYFNGIGSQKGGYCKW